MSTNTYLPGTPCSPLSLLITAISQTNPMVITVADTNNYIVGQLVDLTVPYDYGMYQANDLIAQIIAIDGTGLNFTVNVDATQFDPFVVPAMYQPMPAQLTSAGARNVYDYTSLPFHSLTNVGN
jgi:hypothetical protein